MVHPTSRLVSTEGVPFCRLSASDVDRVRPIPSSATSDFQAGVSDSGFSRLIATNLVKRIAGACVPV